jgi:glycosyltransferase involved in cell wall biosynthesis
MRILEVVHGTPPEVVGGTERYVHEITKGLKDKGHSLWVYSGSLKWKEDFTVETEDRDGIALTTVHRNDLYFDRWDKSYNPLVEEHFRNYLSEVRPHVVHVHHWVRLTSNLCIVAAEAGLPVVVTLHDLYITCPRFFRIKEDGSYCEAPLGVESCLHCAERWLFQRDNEVASALASFQADVMNELRCAVRLLAPSESHAKILSERLGLKDRVIEVLPHGTLASMKPAPRPTSGGKIRIVYFSHLYPSKGPGLLIEAYRKMKHRDQAELHLFGGEVLPEYGKELKRMAEDLAVTFHGPYAPKDLESFPMDLVVIPTVLAESYSFILDEAAGLGVPIVASAVGAIPERATAAVRLFKKGDVDELAGILDEFIADPSRLEALRAAPTVAVVPMDRHVDQLEAIYQEALDAGPRPVEDNRLFDHLKDQWERREFGFKELIRSEQWESLVASLRKRIVELEMELVSRPPPRDGPP